MGPFGVVPLVLLLVLLHSSDAALRTQFQEFVQDVPVPDVKARLFEPQATGPTITVPPPQQLPETLPYILSTPILVQYPGLPAGCLLRADLVLSPQVGTLEFWPGFDDWRNGFAPVAYANGTAAIWMVATLDQINWALSNVKYTPEPDISQDVLLEVTIDDLGCATGQRLTAQGFITLTIVSTNSPPSLTLYGQTNTKQPSFTVMEGADPMPLTFLLSDPDAGNGIMTLNLTAVHGTIQLPVQATVAGYVLTSTSNFQANGSQYALAADLLAGVSFAPTPLFSGVAALIVTVNDNGNTGDPGFNPPLSDTVTVIFNVNPLPTTFTIMATFNTTGIYEGTAGNLFNVSFVDPDVLFEDEPSLYLKCTLAVANGTVSFSQSPAIVTGTGGSYTVIGNYPAMRQTLSTMTYAPAVDFWGPTTVTITLEDYLLPGMQGSASRSATYIVNLNVQGVNNAPRMLGANTTWSVNYGDYLVIGPLTVYDIDANDQTDLMNVTINCTYGALSLAYPPWSLSAPATVSVGSLPSQSYVDVVGGFSFTTTLAGLNVLLGASPAPQGGLGYRSVVPLPAPVSNILSPVLDVDYVTITVNDNGHNGAGGPKQATFKIMVTSYVDQYPTCQAFLALHSQYCGCYFVSGHPNASQTNWTTLALDFPSKLFLKESAPARFSQGCCSTYSYAERQMLLVRVSQLSLCSAS